MRTATLHRNALPALHGAGDEVREGVALHVLHDDVVPLVARADLEDGDDVGMVDPRCEPRLLEEHLDELGFARQVRVKALDPDEPLKAPGAGETTEIHGRHAAGRELGDQLETVEPSALAFDGNELAAQDFGSRAKVMAAIMTPAGSERLLRAPACPIPTTGTDASACGPAPRCVLPAVAGERPLREEEADHRGGDPEDARDGDQNVRPDLGALPLS